MNRYLADFQFNQGYDKWIWNGKCDNHTFSVKAFKNLIDDPEVGNEHKFTFVNWIPIKLNCFTWLMTKNRIPLYTNLEKRGIVVDCTMCPFFLSLMKILITCFFFFSIVFKLWEWLINQSLILNHIHVSCADLVDMLESKDRSKKVSKLKLSLCNTVHVVERKECNRFLEKKANNYTYWRRY